MEIKSICLKNFRQFYGEQRFKLAPRGRKNVTLIHAENGVGKTTILNSVLWTFFGETTKKFEQRDRILNFEAEKEGETSAGVEIIFTHEKVDYFAMRSVTMSPSGQSRSRFAVMRIERNGALGEHLPNPKAFMETVIPSAMAPYFFFDGEQAETFSAETNNKHIAAAIRDILGSTLIENAISDLRFVAKKFNEEIGVAAGDREIQRLESRISELESLKEERNERIRSLDKEIDAVNEQLTSISKSLLEAKEAAHFERARDDKKHQLKVTRDQLSEARVEMLRWISTKAIAAISPTLTSQSLDFIDEESLKGRIPSPYNEDFVKSLLHAQKCVCERTLEPGSAEWRSIANLLSSAANAEVLSRV